MGFDCISQALDLAMIDLSAAKNKLDKMDLKASFIFLREKPAKKDYPNVQEGYSSEPPKQQDFDELISDYERLKQV